MKLTTEQRALLTLLAAAGLDGVTVEGLLLAVKDAGFDDLTLDDIRGKQGLQSLSLAGLVQFKAARWYITRKGKESLA